MKQLYNIEATENPTGTNLKPPLDWMASKSPAPCKCGNYDLQLVEVYPPEPHYPARVAIKCRSCDHTGSDTCHGKDHAIRRWNWEIKP